MKTMLKEQNAEGREATEKKENKTPAYKKKSLQFHF